MRIPPPPWCCRGVRVRLVGVCTYARVNRGSTQGGNALVRGGMQRGAVTGGSGDLLEVPGDGLDAELGLEEGKERMRVFAVDLDLAEQWKLGLQPSLLCTAMHTPCSILVP